MLFKVAVSILSFNMTSKYYSDSFMSTWRPQLLACNINIPFGWLKTVVINSIFTVNTESSVLIVLCFALLNCWVTSPVYMWSKWLVLVHIWLDKGAICV